MYECGIYQITCSKNSKIYIGSSCDIPIRWRDHKCRLKTNKHGNIHLQRAWNKYGEIFFSFDILEECKPEELIAREQYWIDKSLAYDHDIGFNMADRASVYSKRYIITKPSGEEILISSLRSFCNENNLDYSCMLDVSSGRANQHKKYLCRHHDCSKEDWFSKKQRKNKSGHGWDGKWIITKPNGEKEVVESLNKYCVENNISQPNMMKVVKGDIKQHKGYKCEYF